jgi:hypothetical protein
MGGGNVDGVHRSRGTVTVMVGDVYWVQSIRHVRTDRPIAVGGGKRRCGRATVRQRHQVLTSRLFSAHSQRIRYNA